MILTIDNLDGLGAVDYSAAVDRGAGPLTITRTLNAPSLAKGVLCLSGTTLAVPIRRARVVIAADAGTLLFTGYLTTEPVAVYAGVASEGSVYRLAFSAVSDEWLLDKQTSGASLGASLATSGGSIVKTLVERLDNGRLSTASIGSGRSVGVFEPPAGATWSGHSGAAADATYSACRVLNGTVTFVPAGSVVHAFNDGDGTLSIAGLSTAAVRELANDVTLSGEMEPDAYWTEVFAGDGTTAAFELAGAPDAPAQGHATLLDDSFPGTTFDPRTWLLTDPGSHLLPSGGATGTGLALTGGNGFDGETTLAAWDAVELGGTVVIELGRVSLTSGSAGVLGGLYMGTTMQSNCFAGFNVRQSGGNTLVTPLVNGAEVGTSFTFVDGHAYTMRLHLHCAEVLRVKQSFYANPGTGVEQFGGGLVEASAALVFEVRDLGASSNTPVTILYDGVVTTSPALATFVAVNSWQLFGSIGSVKVANTGSAWIQTTDPTTGTPSTRLAGLANEGLDCSVTSSVTGKVTFVAGRIPIVGEIVKVAYRGRSRAVARLADAASLAAEAAGGAVGTARWIGRVVRPKARSSEDCESAAQAVLSLSTSRAAAVTGSYVAVNPAPGATHDIWPGDVLSLTTDGSTVNVLVRRVEVDEHGASPEALTYRIAFANDWAEGLGIHLSEALAHDALLPVSALNLAPGTPAPVLANLPGLAITAVTGTGSSAALTVDAGTDPPAGGGFEVRRRDGGFGPGATASASGDLLLRSPVRGFSIPRAAVEETFFIRMYDSSATPLYSRRSSAIATHLPIG